MPALTLSLVRDEMFKRGWIVQPSQPDQDGLVFRRGLQQLDLTNTHMASSRFTMRTFMRELDAYDQRAR